MRRPPEFLRPGGTCVNTFFVMDEYALDAMRSGRADRSYVSQGPGVFVADPDNPNFGIGFTPDVITSLHGTHDLAIIRPIHFGDWTGREGSPFVYQDVVVARKGMEGSE